MRHLSNIIALSLLFGGNAMMAQEVSIDVAKSRTLDFLSRQSIGPKFAKGTTSSTDLNLAYTSKSEAKTCFYVFNVGDDNGFVIAGGDEAALEILGYCDHGSFDYDTANPAFKWWLDQYTEQIAHAQVSTSSPRKAKAQTAERNSIEPLIKTKWYQSYPYNSEIPGNESIGYRYYTGCVATSMAQVMKYWEHPIKGTGSHSYVNNTLYGNGGDSKTYEANFGETTYDWKNMIDQYSLGSQEVNYTEKEAKAVGTLMYHAGVSVNMGYNTSASYAYPHAIPPALINYFGYDKSISNELRKYYSDEAWSDIIYNELNEHRPVLYGGGGHSFICDGYDAEDDMFSINWGWNGSGDGYYALNSAPDSDYLKSGAHIQLNVKPAVEGSESEEVLHIGQLNEELFVKVGDESSSVNCVYDRSTDALECSLNLCIYNLCTLSDVFDFGVMAVHEDYGITYYSTSKSNQYFIVGGVTNTVQEFVFYPYYWFAGTYKLYPVFRKHGQTSDADWKKMDIIYGLKLPKITLKNNYSPKEVHFSVEKNYVLLGQSLQIEHDNIYSGKITYTSSNNEIATVDENGVITPVNFGKVTITAQGEADSYFLNTTKQFTIDVLEKDILKLVIENDKIMPGEYTYIYCLTDEYEGTIEFQSSDERIVSVNEWGDVKAIYPGEAIIHVTASETELNSKTEIDFKITVLPDVAFTYEPTFKNNNNVYDNYWFLYYTLKNETDEVAEGKIYAVIEDERLFSGPILEYTLEPGEEISQCFDFDYYFNWFQEEYSDYYSEDGHLSNYVSPGEKLHLYLYRDMEEYIPWNYSEIVFTYCPTLSVPYRVSPSGFGTLILPYDWDVPYDMKVYTCEGVDENNVLTLEEYSSDYYDRNVPYIVYGDPQKQYTFMGPDAIEGDSYQAGLLIGAVSDNVPLEIGTDYILQDQGGKVAFYRYMGNPEGRKATRFRAFLRLPEDASRQAPKINFPGNGDDETEGISTLSTDTLPAGIYSIDGHRHSSLQKGLNILILDDGSVQKVFVK